MQTELPAKLTEIVEEFKWCEGREKLELLIQYAETLPPLPDWLQSDRSKMEPVPECLTPVFIHAEHSHGRLSFYFDVPPESPMVRGYAAIMRLGLDQATPEQVLKVPGDFYYEMGLHQVLSHQRLNGISAILAYMKQLAVKALETAE